MLEFIVMQMRKANREKGYCVFFFSVVCSFLFEICPGFNTNEIQIPYDKHHKVYSLVKSHLNTQNLVKYEVV